jgi:hypothetical protein
MERTYLGVLELSNGDVIEVIEEQDKLIYGTMCNNGLIERGSIDKEGFSTDEVLAELLSKLELDILLEKQLMENK